MRNAHRMSQPFRTGLSLHRQIRPSVNIMRHSSPLRTDIAKSRIALAQSLFRAPKSCKMRTRLSLQNSISNLRLSKRPAIKLMLPIIRSQRQRTNIFNIQPDLQAALPRSRDRQRRCGSNRNSPTRKRRQQPTKSRRLAPNRQRQPQPLQPKPNLSRAQRSIQRRQRTPIRNLSWRNHQHGRNHCFELFLQLWTLAHDNSAKQTEQTNPAGISDRTRIPRIARSPARSRWQSAQ